MSHFASIMPLMAFLGLRFRYWVIIIVVLVIIIAGLFWVQRRQY